MVVALAVLIAAPAHAHAAGFAFDNTVNVLTGGPDGSIYASGRFGNQQPLTGGGLRIRTDGNGVPEGGQPVPGSVYAAVADGNGGWFIGGAFDRAGGANVRNLAHLDAAGNADPNWAPNPDGPVHALALGAGTLYAGGDFVNAGGAPHARIAAIDVASGAVAAWSAGFRRSGARARARRLAAVRGRDVHEGRGRAAQLRRRPVRGHRQARPGLVPKPGLRGRCARRLGVEPLRRRRVRRDRRRLALRPGRARHHDRRRKRLESDQLLGQGAGDRRRAALCRELRRHPRLQPRRRYAARLDPAAPDRLERDLQPRGRRQHALRRRSSEHRLLRAARRPGRAEPRRRQALGLESAAQRVRLRGRGDARDGLRGRDLQRRRAAARDRHRHRPPAPRR